MKKVIVLSLILIFCSACAYADIVYKKNGEKIECKVKPDYYDDQICVETSNKLFYIKKSDIEKVVYETGKQNDGTIDWGMVLTISGFSILAFVLALWGRNL